MMSRTGVKKYKKDVEKGRAEARPIGGKRKRQTDFVSILETFSTVSPSI